MDLARTTVSRLRRITHTHQEALRLFCGFRRAALHQIMNSVAAAGPQARRGGDRMQTNHRNDIKNSHLRQPDDHRLGGGHSGTVNAPPVVQLLWPSHLLTFNRGRHVHTMQFSQ